MKKKKNKYPIDRQFQELAIKINKILIKNDSLIGDQKEQVEKVFDLESKFKNSIQRYQQTFEIYKKFINFIIKENGNILSARPFFREKTEVFSENITKSIRESDAVDLMRYNINFQLINFIIKNWKGKFPKRAKKYYDDFIEARKILIENNLPLAINRAKLFYRKTPKSHLSILDMIDICTYGLISGIDKYVGEYRPVWRSVCIGRMVGYLIDEYSKTFLRMYPTDKKILYRANSLKYRLKIENTEELTVAVNESFYSDKKAGKKVPKLPISEVHIRTLLNGSSYISADIKKNNEDNKASIYDYAPSNEENAEESLIKKDLLKKIIEVAKNLEVIERKIIKLKGVNL